VDADDAKMSARRANQSRRHAPFSPASAIRSRLSNFLAWPVNRVTAAFEQIAICLLRQRTGYVDIHPQTKL